MSHRWVVVVSLLASGCQSATLWGSLAVFAVSLGIFLSTLGLGRLR